MVFLHSVIVYDMNKAAETRLRRMLHLWGMLPQGCDRHFNKTLVDYVKLSKKTKI